MLIDLFIKAGWHTVPMKGKLERLENGKKTLPHMEEEWRKKYTANFNEERVRLAGAISGAKSGFIAIDCDNDVTYTIFKALDPDYSFHFVSKGKPAGGGTIIYRYTPDVGGFKLSNGTLALDFYSDEGFIYLPTEDNYTKESWEGTVELPVLNDAPPAVLAMLSTLKSKSAASGVVNTPAIRHTISNRLAPMLETFVKVKKYDAQLFKIITPYSFRDLPTYITKGHLHPEDIPAGRGSEYLSKVSAILGADISVSVELYTNTMMLINSFWSDPMEKTQLLKTIINPMIEERSTVDGKTIWQYDPHWEKMGFIATTLNGNYIESFYDDVKGLYYLVNYTVPYVRTYSDKRPLITTLKTLLGRPVTETTYDTSKQLIRTSLNPSLEFGHIEGGDQFNLFRQTQELHILNNPAPYKSQYQRPNTIIKYFESLIPDDFVRSYVLSFIKTKLTTFKYSPVMLYMIGKPGSGKDTMVGILRTILGQDYVAKPDTKVFLEQYNGWMIDKYIIQLDEYGNKLNRMSDKQEVLGKLKAYTGSAELQIRAMRSDGYNYLHCTTFIVTANSNPLPIETDDRRVCFIKTPNKLEREDWVIEQGGITVVQAAIKAEIMDFCYYLGTEIKTLRADDYVIAPYTSDKDNLIVDCMPAAEKIAYYIQNSKFEALAEWAVEYNIVDFTAGWDKGRLEDEKLQDLYSAVTEGQGLAHTVIRKLKELGLSRSHTTRMGSNSFYYQIPELHKYKATASNTKVENPFEQPKEIKGLS